MKPAYHCIPCHVNHVYRIISQLSPEADKAHSIMQQLTLMIAKNRYDTPPDCAYDLYKTIKELTGIDDPFANVKQQNNDIMLSLMPQLQSMINADEPIKQALRISLAGNIIDYGIGDVDYSGYLKKFQDLVHDIDIPDKFYNQFTASVVNAKKILFIGDNAGEIVADKLLVEKLNHDNITFVVRGGAVINDATIDDAQYVGLNKIVKIVTTGDRTPGINLQRSGKDFLHELLHADMIIAKGQGNFETMIDASLQDFVKPGVKVFFLFKIKCIPVAEYMKKKVGDNAFVIREL